MLKQVRNVLQDVREALPDDESESEEKGKGISEQ